MKKLLEKYLEEFRGLCFVDFRDNLSSDQVRNYEFFSNMFEAALGLTSRITGSTVPHLRIPVDMKVVFTDMDPPLEARVKDISPRGMFVMTDKLFQVGEEVTICTYPDGDSECLTLDGKIVRERPRKSDATDEHLIGVAVEVASNEKNEILCDFFFKLLENAVRTLNE